MHRAPLLPPAVVFLASIVAQIHGYGVPVLCLGMAIAALRCDLAVACFIALVIATVHGHPATVERELPTSRYVGTITGDVRAEDGNVEFPFAVDGVGTLRASTRERVEAGERLTVRARIAPLDEPRNAGEPSARRLALDDGIVGEIVIARILARRPPALRDPRVWSAVVRARLCGIVRRALPEPQATVLAGALWGERGTLPQAVRDDFQATGTVHVLVTAGLHLGVIAAVVGAVFSVLGLPRMAASLIIIPVVFGYALVSGWHLPAQRAATMIAVALIARACGARAVSLNTLALAAMVVAAVWPVAVESVSFALSFSCVTAIVLFAQPIAEKFEKLHLPAPVAETLALTLSTQIGVWPLTAGTFFSVAPYAVLANAVVVPLVSAAMLGGIATIAAHGVPGLGSAIAQWETWLLTIVLLITHGIAALPGARLTMTPPPGWALVGYDLVVIVAAILARKRPLHAAIAIGAACTGVGIAAYVHPATGFSITVLDVGQGDGIVVRTPHGRTILIDTGGRLERGPTVDGRSPAERSAERIVLPYLARGGITTVDLLVITHPHGDHVGGALGILRMMPVGWIADSGQRYGGHAYNDGLAEARTHRVPVIVPACHQRWIDNEVTFTFLSPCGPQFTDGTNDVNENSLVVLVQYRTLRALFMGDAGFQSEERLLAAGVDVHADFLKVGHHGSAYSSSAAFIAAVHPRIAIVSVGRHNLFGHPAPRTLETLRRAGASIFRTDQCGAVTITIGNVAKLEAETMLPCTTVFR